MFFILCESTLKASSTFNVHTFTVELSEVDKIFRLKPAYFSCELLSSWIKLNNHKKEKKKKKKMPCTQIQASKRPPIICYFR